MNKLKDKFLGTIIVSAIGDALGAPYEAFSKDYIESLGPDTLDMYTKSDQYNLEPGEYTDDTAMTLCTLEALIENTYFDIHSVVKKFINWFQTEPKGLGRTTTAALQLLSQGEIYTQASQTVMNEQSAGNGAVMRIAPIILFNYKQDIEHLSQDIIDLSLITHSHKDAISGAIIIGLLIHFNLHNDDKLKNYNKLIENFDLINDDKLLKLIKHIPHLSKEDLIPDGYILNTITTTLYHFLNYNDAITAIKSSITLGGDTDTNAAIIGTLFGSLNGTKGIPKYYIKDLNNNQYIKELADKLYEIVINDKIFY